MANPFVAEIRIFPFNFAPTGVGLLQWPASAHLPEHSAFLAAGDHLRRRREKQLCAS